METTFEDINLVCLCGKPFVWTAGEQKFINELKEAGKLDEEMPDGSVKAGEVKPPRRCLDCRKANKAKRRQQ
jgi:hypothetical protein